MNIQFKGLRLGKLIITTYKEIDETIKINMEAEEIWNLFRKAVREGKITFKGNKDDK